MCFSKKAICSGVAGASAARDRPAVRKTPTPRQASLGAKDRTLMNQTSFAHTRTVPVHRDVRKWSAPVVWRSRDRQGAGGERSLTLAAPNRRQSRDRQGAGGERSLTLAAPQLNRVDPTNRDRSGLLRI